MTDRLAYRVLETHISNAKAARNRAWRNPPIDRAWYMACHRAQMCAAQYYNQGVRREIERKRAARPEGS